MIKRISNILLIRQDKIGDLVLITPAIRALKEKYPHLRISVLASSYAAPVLKENPFLHEVLLWNQDKPNCAEKALKDRNFGAAVLFFPTWAVSKAVWKAKIPIRIGAGVRPYWFLFTHRVSLHRSRHEKKEWEYNLEALKPLGVNPSSPKGPEIFLSEEEKAWAYRWSKGLPASKGIIGLYPGGGGEIRWPLKRFMELGAKLGSEGWHPVVLWGKGEEEIAETAQREGLTVAPETSIRELAALISICKAMVSNNTGPMHIAAALNRPLVQIFDPRLACSPKRWGYEGRGHRVIMPPVSPCKKCSTSCPHYNCMEKIEPNRVFQAVEDVISETHEG